MRVSRQDPKNAKVVVPASSFSSPLGLRVLSEAGVTPIRDVVGGAGGRRNGWACAGQKRNRCGNAGLTPRPQERKGAAAPPNAR